MEEKKNILYNKKVLITVFALILIVLTAIGVTYAFFNYTRTGEENTLSNGTINFNTEQTGDVVGLTNAFPIDITNGIPQNDTVNVRTINITVFGNTTYNGGIEYLVTSASVSNTANGKRVPIDIEITPTNLGTENSNYYTAVRENAANPIYKIETNEITNNNQKIMVGYIPTGSTGVNGSITIKACIDASKVAITNTYDEDLSPSDDYGTTLDWVGTRTVFDTTEWNNLNLSFRIKIESNEGVWVPNPNNAS